MMSIKLPLIIRIGDGAMHERTEGARTGRGPLSRPVPSTHDAVPDALSDVEIESDEACDTAPAFSREPALVVDLHPG